MYKKTIRYFIIIFNLFLLISSSLFSVSADYDIQDVLLDNSNYLAYQYWFNQGLSTYTVKNGNNTTITYSGNITTGNITGQIGATNVRSNIIGFRNVGNINHFINSTSDTVVRPLSFIQDSQTLGINPISLSLNGMSSSQPNTLKTVYSTGFLTGYAPISSYNSNRAITLTSNNDTYIAFACDIANITVNDIQLLSNSSISNVSITRVAANPSAVPFRQYIFKFSNSGSAVNVVINWTLFSSTTKIRPIYNGTLAYMPNEIREVLGLETREETSLKSIDNKFTSLLDFINSGNSNISNTVNNNDNMTSSFNNADNDWHYIESGSIDNMDLQLQTIGTNNDLYNNGGFLNAVNFISLTFMKFINEDPSNSIGLIITFSLILGLSLTILGKLRN